MNFVITFSRKDEASFVSLRHSRQGKILEKEHRNGHRLTFFKTKTSFFLKCYKYPSLLFSSQTKSLWWSFTSERYPLSRKVAIFFQRNINNINSLLRLRVGMHIIYIYIYIYIYISDERYIPEVEMKTI